MGLRFSILKGLLMEIAVLDPAAGINVDDGGACRASMSRASSAVVPENAAIDSRLTAGCLCRNTCTSIEHMYYQDLPAPQWSYTYTVSLTIANNIPGHWATTVRQDFTPYTPIIQNTYSAWSIVT